MSIDQQIGDNLARARTNAAMSQKDLAEQMRSRGYKWSQATVWNIEKGERPLKVAEALDVVQIVGCSMEYLTAGNAAVIALDDAIGGGMRAEVEFCNAARGFTRAQSRLEQLLEDALSQGEIDATRRAQADHVLSLTLESLLAEWRKASAWAEESDDDGEH